MSRLVAVTVRSLCLSLGLAGLAAAQEPPPLEPPSLEPPRAGAAQDHKTETSPEAGQPGAAERGPAGSPPARGPADAGDPGRHCTRRQAFRRLSATRRGADTNGDFCVLAIARRSAAPVGIHRRPVAFQIQRSPERRAAVCSVAGRDASASGVFHTDEAVERGRSHALRTGDRFSVRGHDPPDDRADRRAIIERPRSRRASRGSPIDERSVA